MILGLHHVAIIASGKASIDFYKRLGFTETYRKERRADTVVLMQGFGIELEIFIDASHPRRACHPETKQTRIPGLSLFGRSYQKNAVRLVQSDDFPENG